MNVKFKMFVNNQTQVTGNFTLYELLMSNYYYNYFFQTIVSVYKKLIYFVLDVIFNPLF